MSLRRLLFWRRLPLRAQLALGLLLPFVALGGALYFVHQALDASVSTAGRAEDAIQAVALHNALLKSVLDAETGERGYVITGQRRFLDPYEAARDSFERAAAELRALEKNDPEDLARIGAIEELFQRWRRTVAEPVIAAQRKSPEMLFSAGFDAYYHLQRLLTHLAAGASPDNRRGGAMDTTLARIAEAVPKGRQTEQAADWERIDELVARFRNAYADLAERDTATAREAALEAGRALAEDLRRLTHAARESEASAASRIAAGEGKAIIDRIRDKVAAGIAQEQRQYRSLAQASRAQARNASLLATTLPLAAGVLGSLLLLAIAVDIVRNIRGLREGADRLAAGDMTARLPADRVDELGRLAASFNTMAHNLAQSREQTQILSSMQSMLGAARDADEALAVTRRCCQKLLPDVAGSLYLIAASRDLAEAALSWSASENHVEAFGIGDCWAIRSGRAYHASAQSAEIACHHTAPEAAASLCVPLVSNDEMLGVLHITRTDGPLTESERELAAIMSEHLSLALANLRLAETLRTQAVRDPLTGAFNRRYLEETLDRELARVQRLDRPLAVLAFDIDHFKQFNDSFGHAAGDLVLQRIVAVTQEVVRRSDIVCRLGGEEFIVIMPEADAELARARAESLRARIADLRLEHLGRSLGQVTVSAGIAVYPINGESGEGLIHCADNALYEAKHSGRNRVVVWAGGATEPPGGTAGSGGTRARWGFH